MEDKAKKSNFLPFRSMTFYTWCYIQLVFLTFILFSSVANSTFAKVPKNAVILQWESPKSVEMACTSNCQCYLRWFVNKHGSVKEDLFNGYILRNNAKSYCTVVADVPGTCYLNLTNKPDAAQTYICLEPGSLAEVSADLIWIGDRVCSSSNVTEGRVNLTCSIEFRGNWAPTMEWKEHSIYGEKVLSVGVNTTTVLNQRVTSTLIMPVQEGSRNYTCATKFDISGKPLHTTAANIPDFNQVWTSSVFTKYEDKIATESVVEVDAAIVVIGILVVMIVATASVVAVLIIRKESEQKNRTESSGNTFIPVRRTRCLKLKLPRGPTEDQNVSSRTA